MRNKEWGRTPPLFFFFCFVSLVIFFAYFFYFYFYLLHFSTFHLLVHFFFFFLLPFSVCLCLCDAFRPFISFYRFICVFFTSDAVVGTRLACVCVCVCVLHSPLFLSVSHMGVWPSRHLKKKKK
ncbi:hypothetical protein TCDM_10049 [Trypanosoma cruzi Dm28c]|uniref:Uncharacterized protein n=1 Tax=Trypanosoma cruzi Dm28c TaxID=1416333 RepID=V5B3W6_TRYCR|nr:hypothetical protein TCDM_10049 [Trypanosoma cruzi Dm28c]